MFFSWIISYRCIYIDASIVGNGLCADRSEEPFHISGLYLWLYMYRYINRIIIYHVWKSPDHSPLWHIDSSRPNISLHRKPVILEWKPFSACSVEMRGFWIVQMPKQLVSASRVYISQSHVNKRDGMTIRQTASCLLYASYIGEPRVCSEKQKPLRIAFSLKVLAISPLWLWGAAGVAMSEMSKYPSFWRTNGMARHISRLSWIGVACQLCGIPYCPSVLWQRM